MFEGRAPPGPLRWSFPSHFDASQGARLDRPAGRCSSGPIARPVPGDAWHLCALVS
jgi:hypothetical protein